MSPNDRKYTKEHEWVKVEDAASGRALAGITDYAQDQLGDERLADHPELTNQDPYGEGWLIRVAMADAAELETLMSAEEYEAYVGGL